MAPKPPVDPFTCRRVLENQRTATLYFDADLVLRYANQAAEILFCASDRALQGRRAGALIDCPRSDLMQIIERARKTGSPFTERELPLSLCRGEQITLDCTVTPVDEESGRGVLMELMPVDRKLRISLNGGMQAQQQAGRDLLRGLAHEIKNPLGGLRGAAQLLADELGESELVEYTQIIIAEADRLRGLVDRMVAPTRPPAEEVVNLHEVLERVRGLLLNDTPPGVQIDFDYDPSLPELRGDRDQLIQALLNIARNAVNAVGDQGTVTLRTRCERNFTIKGKAERLCVTAEVVDDGPGIDRDMRSRMFLPMVTGHADGTGLGLPIAQQLVQAHGGLIDYSSEAGHTVFRVILPIKDSK